MLEYRTLSKEESDEFDRKAAMLADFFISQLSGVKEADDIAKVRMLADILLLHGYLRGEYEAHPGHTVFGDAAEFLAVHNDISRLRRELMDRWLCVYQGKYYEFMDEFTDELGTVHFRFADRISRTIGWFACTVQTYQKYSDEGMTEEKRDEIMGYVDGNIDLMTGLMEEVYGYGEKDGKAVP